METSGYAVSEIFSSSVNPRCFSKTDDTEGGNEPIKMDPADHTSQNVLVVFSPLIHYAIATETVILAQPLHLKLKQTTPEKYQSIIEEEIYNLLETEISLCQTFF